MGLSNQFRPLRRCVFSGFALCCTVALIGCGGSEEPASTDAGTSTETAGGSSSSGAPPMQGMSSMPGGSTPGAASAPDGQGASATGMSGAPGTSGEAGGGAMTMSMPGMRAGAGGSSSMPGAAGMGSMPMGNPGGESDGAYAGDGYSGGGYAGGHVALKSPRPDSYDAWTDADFVSAAREHDPRVLEAIDFKVKSAPGDASVALLLTSLLDLPPLPAPTNSNGAGSGYPGMSGAPSEGGSYPGASGFGSGGPPGATGTPNPRGSMQGRGAQGSAPGSSPSSAPALAPQSSLGNPKNENLSDAANGQRKSIDSVSAMILEAAVAYMPQGAAVGAIAGGAAGRIEGFSGQAPGGASTPGAMPGGAMPGGAMPGGAMPGGGFPGGGYPGSGFPGGNASDANGSPNSIQLQDKLLVAKVVDGLIANNSQEAWQAVFGIVAGTVKTPLPNTDNCEIVVERLVQNMDSNPGVIQPVVLAFLDSATPVPSESRTACMRMLAAISATHTDTLTGFAITEIPPANVPGATSGYPSGAGGFAGMSGLGGQPSMGGAGGNAATPQNSSLPPVSLAPDVVEIGASFLWSPKTVAAIVSQLEKTTDLTTASDVLLLASTIPGTVVRNAVCETFLRLHPSGADGLIASGIFSDVHDPGMLVILKALPRTRPAKDAPGTMDSWTAGTESLVLALRDELKRTSGSMKPYTDALPVKLHKNATAEVSVMLQIPAGTTEQSSDSIPAATTVYYTRTSFTPVRKNDSKDLTAHYEGRTSGYSRDDVARGLKWIEGVKVLPNGHRRTLDVVIQKGGAGDSNGQMGFGGAPSGGFGGAPGGGEVGFGGGSGAGGSYTVEIIVVDTEDPKTASPAATTQASAKP